MYTFANICRFCKQNDKNILDITSKMCNEIIHLYNFLSNDKEEELNICLKHICNKCFKLLLAVSDIQHECERTDAIFISYLNILKNNGKQYGNCKSIIKKDMFNNNKFVSILHENAIKNEIDKQVSFVWNNIKETSELIQVDTNEIQQIKREVEDALIKRECDEDNNSDSNTEFFEQSNTILSRTTTEDESFIPIDFWEECFQDEINHKEIIEHNEEQNTDIKMEEYTIDWPIKDERTDISNLRCNNILLNQNKNCFQNTQGFEAGTSKQLIEEAFEENDRKKPKFKQCSDNILTNRCLNSFICDVCNKTFTTMNIFIKHMHIHSDERRFECDVCKKIFKRISNLNRHKESHTDERPFECNICYKRFKNKSTLNEHGRSHTDEWPFECDICNKRFKNKSNLYRHRRSHTDEWPFECDVCYSKFKIKSYFNIHKRCHTVERPFECDVCKKRFKDKSNLNRHKRSHTDERPFECDVCNKRYTHKWHLTTHTRIHTGERPFECDVCNQKCYTKSHLIKHLRIHTVE